jgi:hypothetical protein
LITVAGRSESAPSSRCAQRPICRQLPLFRHCRRGGAEEAHEPTFVRSAACACVLLVDVVVLFLALFAQKAGQEHATQAPTARYVAANQEALESFVFVSAASGRPVAQ